MSTDTNTEEGQRQASEMKLRRQAHVVCGGVVVCGIVCVQGGVWWLRCGGGVCRVVCGGLGVVVVCAGWCVVA